MFLLFLKTYKSKNKRQNKTPEIGRIIWTNLGG